AAMPPLLVGGMSDAALRRTVQFADGWFSLPVAPAVVATVRERLAELASAAGRAAPSVTAAVITATTGDPAVPARDELLRSLTDPDGKYGMPSEIADEMLLTGDVSVLAERLHDLVSAGADRVVVDVAGGDWFRQVELIVEARRQVVDRGR
ncbi:MAG TPA: LLM class flavin-dependent oxidoreductase, partial [Acidimicrobiales bacterium]